MTLQRLLRLVLALALLAAWQVALVHPLKHSNAQGGLVHFAGAQHGSGESNSAPNALCDAIAAVAACVGGANHTVVAAPCGADAIPLLLSEAPPSAPTLAYRSQAPPALL